LCFCGKIYLFQQKPEKILFIFEIRKYQGKEPGVFRNSAFSKNYLKIMPQNAPRRRVAAAEPSRKKKFNFTAQAFRWVNQKLEIDEKISMGTFKKVLWLMGLTVVYIFFQHNFHFFPILSHIGRSIYHYKPILCSLWSLPCFHL
jgi:hypothetical protein